MGEWLQYPAGATAHGDGPGSECQVTEHIRLMVDEESVGLEVDTCDVHGEHDTPESLQAYADGILLEWITGAADELGFALVAKHERFVDALVADIMTEFGRLYDDALVADIMTEFGRLYDEGVAQGALDLVDLLCGCQAERRVVTLRPCHEGGSFCNCCTIHRDGCKGR